MIDASHANSGKDHVRQAVVASEIAGQVAAGQAGIGGVMLESFLVAGRQEIGPEMTYGQSRHRRLHGLGHHGGCSGYPRGERARAALGGGRLTGARPAPGRRATSRCGRVGGVRRGTPPTRPGSGPPVLGRSWSWLST
ncbi:hypothetical protein ACFQX7_36030 [Luedemannella flava]